LFCKKLNLKSSKQDYEHVGCTFYLAFKESFHLCCLSNVKGCPRACKHQVERTFSDPRWQTSFRLSWHSI